MVQELGSPICTKATLPRREHPSKSNPTNNTVIDRRFHNETTLSVDCHCIIAIHNVPTLFESDATIPSARDGIAFKCASRPKQQLSRVKVSEGIPRAKFSCPNSIKDGSNSLNPVENTSCWPKNSYNSLDMFQHAFKIGTPFTLAIHFVMECMWSPLY